MKKGAHINGIWFVHGKCSYSAECGGTYFWGEAWYIFMSCNVRSSSELILLNRWWVTVLMKVETFLKVLRSLKKISYIHLNQAYDQIYFSPLIYLQKKRWINQINCSKLLTALLWSWLISLPNETATINFQLSHSNCRNKKKDDKDCIPQT